ncbi:2-dehydro-3-deoxygalactonokinase [Devosia enhydra]|uniref:2-dehydro-3-deoxygalactonokinase n=1 Tax=Devosia enhydra TaxID=665118 RepID=A0A1K2HUD3_9HYPH|nr:2-dehydro-3-deoxygalactonokinase [Devosia enhydra]SFZ82069.1 2-dehydro-3-deoxygalactonokinase [Devosia enhydra]
MGESVAWVAVDWGTSNVRAWGVSADGGIVASARSEAGMARLTPEAYPAALDLLLTDMAIPAGAPLEVLICGMAGARQGWREAPYLEVPAELGGLALSAVEPLGTRPGLSARIQPGVCHKGVGSEDVMRGEETQLLGLSRLLPGFSGLAVLPGTHCKWAELDGRRLTRFGSAMTGEVFEALAQHTVLRHSLAGDVVESEREAGFDDGVEAALARPERLLSSLFRVRTGALLSGKSPSWCRGFLSGLLIGTEIAGFRNWGGDEEVPLIGSTALCALYGRGLAAIGRKSRIVDATDCTLAGLRAARELL